MSRRLPPRHPPLPFAVALGTLLWLPAAASLAAASGEHAVVVPARTPAPAVPAPMPAGAFPETRPAQHTEVTVAGDHLTVRVVGVPLDEVVRRIADASGARLEGALRASTPVSVEIESVPLHDGLERLLGDQNFMLAYRPDGRLSRLVLLGGPQEAPATQVVKLGPEPGAELGGDPGVLQRTVTLPPGPVSSRLGRERATLQELLDLALRSSDGALRTDAVRAGIRAVDEQPELNAAVSAALLDMDDATLAVAVKSFAGDHANEALSQVLTFSKTPALRERGIRVFQRMVAGVQ